MNGRLGRKFELKNRPQNSAENYARNSQQFGIRPRWITVWIAMQTKLTSVEESLLVAAYFRGRTPAEFRWVSNCDQVITLSFFYTGEISADDCMARFNVKSYVGKLYDRDGELMNDIQSRYAILIDLIRKRPDLISGGGNFETPADPTYTSCRLTLSGITLAVQLRRSFPKKPEFPNWPDKYPE